MVVGVEVGVRGVDVSEGVADSAWVGEGVKVPVGVIVEVGS